MLKISDFTEFSDYSNVRKLWNEEVGFIYPISDEVFDHHVVNSPYLAKNASFAAYLDNLLVGVVIIKTYSGEEIPAYNDRAWISLFYVSKRFRRQGIGSLLLEKAINKVKEIGKKEIHMGQDLGNLFPGIPCDFDNLTANFIEKRGFKLLGYTHDLLLKEPYIKKENNKLGLIYRFATIDDKDNLLDFLLKNFPGRWHYEAVEYFKKEYRSNNYYIALDKDEIVGFVRVNEEKDKIYAYNTNWSSRFKNLVGIGPLGVDRERRGNGISKEMISTLLSNLHEEGKDEILIDWTGLLVYYQQFGFEVWKCYMKAKMILG